VSRLVPVLVEAIAAVVAAMVALVGLGSAAMRKAGLWWS